MSPERLGENDMVLYTLSPQEIADGILGRVDTSIPEDEKGTRCARDLERIRVIRNLAMYQVAQRKEYNAEVLEIMRIVQRRKCHLHDMGIDPQIDGEFQELTDALYRARERLHHRLLRDPDVQRIVRNAYEKREKRLLQVLKSE